MKKIMSIKISIFFMLMVLCHISQGQFLDMTFGSGGIVTTDFGISVDYAEAVAIQSDGKIVVAGNKCSSSGSAFVLARYNIDGTLDTSFGTGGIVITSVVGLDNWLSAVIIQADGKIVAAGKSDEYLIVLRYNSNGSLDPTFNSTGILTSDLGVGSAAANDLAQQPDGKIVVAGACADLSVDFALVRLNIDGSFDNTFHVDGIVTTPMGSGYDNIASLLIQSDGKIVAAGRSDNGTSYDFAVARYNADGSLDNSFDVDGKIVTSFGSGDDVANCIAQQTDGKIVVAGISNNSVDNDIAMARYNVNGSLDLSFHTDGKVITDYSSSDDIVEDMLIQGDGKIILGGSINNGGYTDFALTRYNSDGNVDLSYDTDGFVITGNSIFNDAIKALAMQSDGKIISAGVNFLDSDPDFIVTRYDINGDLDVTFSSDGVVNTAVNSDPCSSEYGRSVVIQNDGKIVVAGFFYTGNLNSYGIARYLSDGTLDTSFGFDGIVSTPFNSNFNQSYSLAIQNDGKIIVTGFAGPSFLYMDYIAIRYNADGSLDNTFGTGGIVKTDLDDFDDPQDVVIQTDGKIILAGFSHNDSGSPNDFVLLRYNSDGTLDLTFGNNGVVITDVSTISDLIRSVKLQSDGKIVVAGHSSGGANEDFILARYNSDGSLDLTFDGDGMVVHDFGASSERSYSCVIQSDGKIILGGVLMHSSNKNFAVARYNMDGSVDASFGLNGVVITDISGYDDELRSVVIQADGKIIGVGYSSDNVMNSFTVVRYNIDGTLDNTFDTDGIMTTAIGNNAESYSTALQTDGKIIVAGLSDDGFNNNFAIARYFPENYAAIPQEKEPTQISIYPNPVAEQLTIVLDQHVTNGTVKISDLSGRLIKQEENVSGTTFTLDVSDQSSGIYFIEFYDGVLLQKIRFVKN